jgi:hypothetical protein
MRHPFHALCPYFAMFPESFAERWIGDLSRRGDVVVDPFSGRGTTAFQALLMGRRAVACDINDVAACITRAKTHAPLLANVSRRVDVLESEFDRRTWRRNATDLSEFFHVAYHPDTLPQVVYLRDALQWRTSRVDCMVAALALRALHGESQKSPAYFSNRMPRTISTKPAYSIRFWRDRKLTAPHRNVFAILRQQAEFRYETPPARGEAWVFHRDMRRLPALTARLARPIRLAVTSPPYFDVTSFEEDQWLRLWFLGHEPRPTKRRISRDDRHESARAYWAFIADMWRMFGKVMARKAHVVIRLGGRAGDPGEMVSKLADAGRWAGRPLRLVSHEISALRGRQTGAFRPGSQGCLAEVDSHFQFSP